MEPEKLTSAITLNCLEMLKKLLKTFPKNMRDSLVGGGVTLMKIEEVSNILFICR